MNRPKKCTHRPNRYDVIYSNGTATRGSELVDYYLQWCPTCGAIRQLTSRIGQRMEPRTQWRRPGRGVEHGIPVLRGLVDRRKATK